MNRQKLAEELQWMNWKSFMLIWLVAHGIAIAIAVFATSFTGIGFVLGIAAYVICHLWLQKRMANKLADKIMAAHREDYTVYVDTRLVAKK